MPLQEDLEIGVPAGVGGILLILLAIFFVRRASRKPPSSTLREPLLAGKPDHMDGVEMAAMEAPKVQQQQQQQQPQQQQMQQPPPPPVAKAKGDNNLHTGDYSNGTWCSV